MESGSLVNAKLINTWFPILLNDAENRNTIRTPEETRIRYEDYCVAVCMCMDVAQSEILLLGLVVPVLHRKVAASRPPGSWCAGKRYGKIKCLRMIGRKGRPIAKELSCKRRR